jgi:N-formylglutamate deformylase
MARPVFEIRHGDTPLIAVANHHGHDLREEAAGLIALDERQRLAEEDPHTGGWTRLAETRAVVHRSRFEVDMNRSRDQAVYLDPADAWGLQVWKGRPPRPFVGRSLAAYDAYYSDMQRVLARAAETFGAFVVYDLHTYNHRRGGPDAPPDDPAENPEINVGTGSMPRGRWAAIVERFIRDLRAHDFGGRRLDVRENVRFRGGHFPRWVHETFPDSGCALAIEVKKFFMDEHSGELFEDVWNAVHAALEATVPGVLEELRRR